MSERPDLDRRSLMAGATAAGLASAASSAVARAAPAGETVVVTGQAPVVSLQTWLDVHGRPTAQVRVNGQGPFRFMVDTGSTTTVVSGAIARRLALPALPAAMVHTVTESREAPFARVAGIEVGATRAENLRAVVLDGPAFAGADGILGMDVFAGRRVRFHLNRNEVEFLAPGRGGPLPVRVPVIFRSGLLPEVRGRIGGVAARFVLDTGAQTSMMNLALTRELTRVRRGRRGRELAVVLGVTTRELNGLWVAAPTLEALGLTITRLSAISADSPVFRVWGLAEAPAMILGMDVLSGLETIQIDYRRREIQLRLASLMSGRATAVSG